MAESKNRTTETVAATRRSFLKTAGAAGLAVALGKVSSLAAATGRTSGTNQPNVLFISIDDMNDWVGCMGEYPGVKTPNLDRLADRGVLFTNAHCSAPLCNPSRTSVMTGILPSTSGVYNNTSPMRKSSVLKNAITIPQHFKENGYRTFGSGKIFHYRDSRSWNNYWPETGPMSPKSPQPPPESIPVNGINDLGFFDWAPLDIPVEETSDWKIADWIAARLQEERMKPFFAGCGFFRPHLPWYVPRKYFDMYPLDDIKMPEIRDGDLDDIPAVGRRNATHRDDHGQVVKHGQWKEGIQGFLASVSYADDCLGHVLDALDNGPHRDNTIIVAWSDNGFHLGEKGHWRKGLLWEESTRVYLAISAPGIAKPAGRCSAPVSLLDLYPTLIDTCSLPARAELEGQSLLPLLRNPESGRSRPALTTAYRDHAVRSDRWRYIRYHNGEEELYDHSTDRHEWNNLAGDPAYKDVIKELEKWIPSRIAPISPHRKN